jgi:hypothetical protein
VGNRTSSAHPPSLNLEFAEDGGRLSLDFSNDDNVDPHANHGRPGSEHLPHLDKFGEEAGELDSELPWVKTGQRTRKSFIQRDIVRADDNGLTLY